MNLVAPASPAPTAALLSARDLACRRGDRLLFEGLGFDLPPASVLWLKGPNGRGKTSLLRLLATLSRPERGDILWGGRPCTDPEAGYLEHCVYIAHHNALKDDLSVAESLQFLARIHRRAWDRASIEAALRRFGMHSRRNALVRTLSQGQRRRAALARLALETTPGVWLLDEPYDALDAAGCALLSECIGAHVARGGRVMLTSHQLIDVAAEVLELEAA